MAIYYVATVWSFLVSLWCVYMQREAHKEAQKYLAEALDAQAENELLRNALRKTALGEEMLDATLRIRDEVMGRVKVD